MSRSSRVLCTGPVWLQAELSWNHQDAAVNEESPSNQATSRQQAVGKQSVCANRYYTAAVTLRLACADTWCKQTCTRHALHQAQACNATVTFSRALFRAVMTAAMPSQACTHSTPRLGTKQTRDVSLTLVRSLTTSTSSNTTSELSAAEMQHARQHAGAATRMGGAAA